MTFREAVAWSVVLHLLATADFAFNYVVLRWAFSTFHPDAAWLAGLAAVWTAMLVMLVARRP